MMYDRLEELEIHKAMRVPPWLGPPYTRHIEQCLLEHHIYVTYEQVIYEHFTYSTHYNTLRRCGFRAIVENQSDPIRLGIPTIC